MVDSIRAYSYSGNRAKTSIRETPASPFVMEPHLTTFPNMIDGVQKIELQLRSDGFQNYEGCYNLWQNK